MRVSGLLPRGVPDTEVAREAAIAGLQIKALSQCYIRPPARGGLILDCTSLDPERAHDAARALGSVIRRYASPPCPRRPRARAESPDDLRQPA